MQRTWQVGYEVCTLLLKLSFVLPLRQQLVATAGRALEKQASVRMPQHSIGNVLNVFSCFLACRSDHRWKDSSCL